jgi:hypothetical protein
VHLGLKNPPSIQLKVTCLRQLPHCTNIYFSSIKHHFVVICMEEKIILKFCWLDRTQWSQWTYLCLCCQFFNLPIWFSTKLVYFQMWKSLLISFITKKSNDNMNFINLYDEIHVQLMWMIIFIWRHMSKSCTTWC